MKTLQHLLLIVTFSTPFSTFGGENVGTIDVYHLNGTVPGRGVCVRMTPELPYGGWSCLYTNNLLYTEITSALLACRISRSECTVSWSDTDTRPGLPITGVNANGVY